MKSYTIYFLCFMLLICNSCKKSADSSPAPEKPFALAGRWKLSAIIKSYNNNSDTYTSAQYPCFSDRVRVIKADGTFTSTYNGSSLCVIDNSVRTTLGSDALSGTCTLNGNEVTFITHYNQDTKVYTFKATLAEVNGKQQLTFTDPDGFGGTFTSVEVKE